MSRSKGRRSIEPPKLELKELSEHLEYAFLQENNQLPVVISSALSATEKTRLLEVLRNHKGAITWSIADIKGIDSSFCTHKILMEDEFKPSVQPQRRVNPKIKEVVVLKKGRMTVKDEKNELIPQRTVTGWRVCIDYRKLNDATRKDHFPLPFIDQILEKLVRHEYYCLLDGFSSSLDHCLKNLEKMLKRCEETNLVLNWEKCYIMERKQSFSITRLLQKIYDPGICIEVESTIFLATLSPVIDTLLPFSSEYEDKVFNHGVLASKEKSPPSSSHRGFKDSKLFHHKSPMLIYEEDIPILDVPFLQFYPP
ncbi:hypothetical protein Tco_0984571 [Tanacetum coccineum]